MAVERNRENRLHDSARQRTLVDGTLMFELRDNVLTKILTASSKIGEGTCQTLLITTTKNMSVQPDEKIDCTFLDRIHLASCRK